MSQAMPTRSGGAGTRRLRVRVKGSAVGTAPAARWALAARALPMRRRPGGTLEVTVAVARSPAVASRSARVRRRAAAASSSWGSRVPVTARGRALRPKTSRAARSALPRTAFSCSRLSAASGGKGGGGGAKSAATASAISSMALARALASSEGMVMMRGAGGAASGSRPRMRHQRRARVARVRRSSSAVAWNSRQVARRRARCSVPMAASTLAVTGAVSSGSRIPASSRASRRAAAAPASRGLAGSAPAAVKSARMSLVALARS